MFPLEAVLGLANSVIDRLFPDPAQKAAAQLEVMKLQQSGELAQIMGQIEVNKVEAGSTSLFVSGWRPAIGWVCALALAYQYLLRPLGGTIAVIVGVTLPPLPGLDDNLWQLMMGMLGMSGLRSFEKTQGLAK
jgi:hypothetical protein